MKKNKTRNHILKKAAEIFAIKGIENTTIEDISNHLGKAKSFIYYYFEDKDSLYREVLSMNLIHSKKRFMKN